MKKILAVAAVSLVALVAANVFGETTYVSTLSVTDGGVATSSALRPGIQHVLTCDSPARAQWGIASTTAASSTSLKVPANQSFPIDLRAQERYISVTPQSGATLSCELHANAVPLGHPYPVNPAGATVTTSISNSSLVVVGADGGAVTTAPLSGHWDCARSAVGVCTSTGPTNHGNLSFTAGSYLIGYCTAAAYTGAAVYVNPDGGSPSTVASCASRDGGAIFNEACMIHPANGLFYRDFRNTTSNSIGCTSVSGTSNCVISSCQN